MPADTPPLPQPDFNRPLADIVNDMPSMGPTLPGLNAITDLQRINFLEELLRSPALPESVVVLGAWWSGKDQPDGFSVNVGECFVDADEHPTLRDAIDDAIREGNPLSSVRALLPPP